MSETIPYPAPELRLRVMSSGLLALPWDRPLAEWDATEIALRDIPVGPSRHLVRFVEADGQLWALKQLPERIAAREYDVLRELENKGLPAVRPAGLVVQHPGAPIRPDGIPEDTAILVTRYLTDSWQYRRLFLRIPPDRAKHRARLLDAMATLLVELHRHGVFWGDCSLANTLFSRDGQVLQAWFVDAETSEVHERLSDGQRAYDLDILVENVAGGMMDMMARMDDPGGLTDELLVAEAQSVAARYEALWDALHAEPTFSFADRYRIEGQVRALQELGFAVEEVALAPVADGTDRLRLRVAVGDRRFHATQLHALTGMDVGEGQAAILLGDLHAYHGALRRSRSSTSGTGASGGGGIGASGGIVADITEAEAAISWLDRVVRPGMRRAHQAVHGVGTPIQAYCDLLEVRWILSERAGHDVGDAVALEALATGTPRDSAAHLALAEPPTGQLPRLTPDLLRQLDDKTPGHPS